MNGDDSQVGGASSTDASGPEMSYLKRSFLDDDTVFVPRWVIHTQISCNVGDLSMVAPHEREMDLKMLLQTGNED